MPAGAASVGPASNGAKSTERMFTSTRAPRARKEHAASRRLAQVVARALTLEPGAPVARGALAPLYSMGLFHATRKRKATSWGFLIGVFGLVKLVKKLSYPWRAVVDAGVVAGLSIGSASILYHWGRALRGVAPPADAALP